MSTLNIESTSLSGGGLHLASTLKHEQPDQLAFSLKTGDEVELIALYLA